MPIRSRVAVLLLVGLALALPSYATPGASKKPQEPAIVSLIKTSWNILARIFERGVAKVDPPAAPANEPPAGNSNGDRGATLDPWG